MRYQIKTLKYVTHSVCSISERQENQRIHKEIVIYYNLSSA